MIWVNSFQRDSFMKQAKLWFLLSLVQWLKHMSTLKWEWRVILCILLFLVLPKVNGEIQVLIHLALPVKLILCRQILSPLWGVAVLSPVILWAWTFFVHMWSKVHWCLKVEEIVYSKIISKALCDASSIESIHASKHTLQELHMSMAKWNFSL